jgi:hypothetical protein
MHEAALANSVASHAQMRNQLLGATALIYGQVTELPACPDVGQLPNCCQRQIWKPRRSLQAVAKTIQGDLWHHQALGSNLKSIPVRFDNYTELC